MRLYIAGPMTGIPEFNFPEFAAAAKYLKNAGYEIESPAQEHDTVESQSTLPYEFYLRRGFKQLLECDGVAVLRGGILSKGTRREAQIAEWLGMKIDSVENWLAFRADFQADFAKGLL